LFFCCAFPDVVGVRGSFFKNNNYMVKIAQKRKRVFFLQITDLRACSNRNCLEC
jgi:hypothetical protein